MTQINEEDRKKIEDWAIDKSASPSDSWHIMNNALFGYHLRDAEVERLRKELNNALSVKVNEQAIKQIVNRPGIVSKICANEIRKNETLESELAALKKQFDEIREYMATQPNMPDWVKELATYITDKQI